MSVFEAFCRQAGIARCDTLGTLCETLKLFHMGGPLAGRKVLVMGASGGDMAMTADVSRAIGAGFCALAAGARRTLREHAHRPRHASPILSIFTLICGSIRRRCGGFSPRCCNAGYDAVGFMLDCPPEGQADAAAFDAVIDVFIDAARGAPTRAALIASLPETISAPEFAGVELDAVQATPANCGTDGLGQRGDQRRARRRPARGLDEHIDDGIE